MSCSLVLIFTLQTNFQNLGIFLDLELFGVFELVQFPTTSPFPIKSGQNESNWENQLAGTIFLAVSVSIDYFINLELI